MRGDLLADGRRLLDGEAMRAVGFRYLAVGTAFGSAASARCKRMPSPLPNQTHSVTSIYARRVRLSRVTYVSNNTTSRTTAVVRSEALSADEIEFLRWRAERWMKLRHFPVALRRNPLFCLRHGRAMIGHTFRGSWRSLVGLESERRAFARYRAIREAEREQL